jgi:broad specificity phosphatase PhoE
MSTLVLVRHGQARFGTVNYDALSPLGIEQCQALARHWRERGVGFDECFSGTMIRQTHSASLALGCKPVENAAWNEYDTDAILHYGAPDLAGRSLEFRMLWEASAQEQGNQKLFQHMFEPLMRAWCRGETCHAEIEPWTAFRDRVRGALQALVDKPGSRRAAVFTSGGPTGCAVMTVLGAPEERALELNWRVKNASVSEFVFSNGRIALDAFNATPHLTHAQETYR